MNGWPLIGLLAVTLALGGCGKPSAAAPGASATAPAPAAAPASPFVSILGAPTKARPKLQTIKVWLGAEELITEMARSPAEVETGMMFRTNMAENEAMIFVLPYVQ